MLEGASVSEILRESNAATLNEAVAIEAELFVGLRQEILPNGKRRLVFKGSQRERDVLFPCGNVTVKIPRISDRKGGDDAITFPSKLVPPFARKSRDLTAIIPPLYLNGVSESSFQEIFDTLFGHHVQGLSHSNINKLLNGWEDEFMAWESRDMSVERYAYIWADGVFFNIRGEKRNTCLLTVLGVGDDGRKRLAGLAEGYAESADSWRELLVKLRSQGMEPPNLVVGDGGLGLWSGLGRIFPDCDRQYCWVHKLRDVRRHLPKERHREAGRQVRDIYMSDTRAVAERKIESLAKVLGVKHPQAAETLTKWSDELLGFYDYPAEHWTYLRTTNPIESMFSTVRLRTDKTRTGLGKGRLKALVFKLAQTASDNMNALPHAGKIRLVLAGKAFKDGEALE